MKKSLLLTLGLLCAAGVSAQAMKLPELHFNPPPRKIKVDKNAKQVFAENGKVYFGIVIPDDAGGPAKYAAEELAFFLGKALNAKIPVAKQRDAKWKHAIILGDNTLSRKAGLNVKNLTRDGFLMKTVGNDIYIAGLDDKDVNTKKLMSRLHFWGEQPMMHQRGTIFGVYDDTKGLFSFGPTTQQKREGEALKAMGGMFAAAIKVAKAGGEVAQETMEQVQDAMNKVEDAATCGLAQYSRLADEAEAKIQ